jgi:hypothetical protein
MIPFCGICNDEIIGRDCRAKFCFLCLKKKSSETGASKAIYQVQKAVKKGILPNVKTLMCVDCGKFGQCYDHRDYNKPLDVVPVCKKCNYRRGSAISAFKKK